MSFTELNAVNVRVAVTGQLYKAGLEVTAPTNVINGLDSRFVGLGYVSDDGVTESWEDSVDDIIAWQNATTVRSSTTESTLSLEATLIETTGAVIQTFHRGSVIVEDPPGHFTIDVKPIVADPSQWVLDIVDGSRLIRIYIGNGEVVERGEIVYANGQPIAWPITLRGYPDADGNICRKFSNDIAWGEGLLAS